MGWITDLLKEVPLSAVLREKLETIEARVKTLEQENASLRSDNERMRKLQHAESASELSEAEINILKLLAQTTRFLDERQIGTALSISTTKCTYYLEKLRKAGYLRMPAVMTEGDCMYQLRQNGREYLIANNLIE
jgi:predicted DNA-binding transcriptional regulator